MTSDWMACDRCPCGYSGDVRGEGERCDDLSWIPAAVYRRGPVTVRMARRLACKGRMRREGMADRWTDEALLAWRVAALAAVGILAKEQG